jgi:hypothetical protein
MNFFQCLLETDAQNHLLNLAFFHTGQPYQKRWEEYRKKFGEYQPDFSASTLLPPTLFTTSTTRRHNKLTRSSLNIYFSQA